MKCFRDNSIESFQIQCMWRISEPTSTKRFSKLFHVKCFRNNTNETFKIYCV